MIVVGINAYHADVSAVLLVDGHLVSAVEEERFRRLKHCAGFPREALRHVVEAAGVAPSQIDCFALSRRPRAHLGRKLLFTLRHRPSLDLIRRRFRNTREVSRVDDEIARALDLSRGRVRGRLYCVEHHPAHLASAFFVSPFEESAIASLDGFGDFVSTSLAEGRGNRMRVRQRVYFPHSLGELYLALTQFLGFPDYGDEFKVMGLAPYGQPRYAEPLRRLVRLGPNGGFQLDLSYFQHWSQGDQMTFAGDRPSIGPVYSAGLERLLGPARLPGQPLEARHEDLAASLQLVFEEAVFHVLRALHAQTRMTDLCLAGGCAMNSVANGKIRAETPFQRVYVQPAAADNGTALGAALFVWNQRLGNPRTLVMDHALWGPEFTDQEVERGLPRQALQDRGCQISRLDSDQLVRRAARALSEGRIVGWFQGRMEWGARALGNRSILADPRRRDMRDVINRKIKFREKFRPFAPAILEEALDEYFVDAVPDPFMQQVYPVRPEKRSRLPAVTHVDGSGRLQTVARASNPLFWSLLKEFESLSGVPVLLNTSFNENEPIVMRPEEALDCFRRTDMDCLALGAWWIEKRRAGTEVEAAPMAEEKA